MAFAVAQPASSADPVIVLLPDGSIRLYHEQLMQVRDVLREFPHHGLASLNHIAASGAGAPPASASSGYCYAMSPQSQPPNAAHLPPERFLRPGGTYCLVEHPVLAAHDALSVNHARRPHDLASCAVECTASDADSRIDDSESPSGDAAVVSCFTPRASRASTRQRVAVATTGGGSGLERAASMPPIHQSLRAALMMPTTPRKPTTTVAASGSAALPPSPGAAATTTVRPLGRTTSGTMPPTAPTFPNSVSLRAPSSAASALISPRAPPASASALISPRAPPASASSLISPRAILSSGSRKLARALTALPRPRRSGTSAARERDGTERSPVPRDVSNHGASGPWSLMDLISPKGRGASASRAAQQLGDDMISAEDMYSWENAIRDLKISRGERDEKGEAESNERQRSGSVRYGSGRNEARQTNWSGGLTPRSLPLLSPVETAAETGEGAQQQGRKAADSVQSTQSTGLYISRVSSQGSLGMARSSSESSDSSCSGGGGSSWRGYASRSSVAESSSGSISASTNDSSSVSSSTKGRLQAASHRLSLFKSLRLHVARPSAAALLGTHAADKAAAVEGTHADGLNRNMLSPTDAGLSSSAAKLACAAGLGEGGGEEIYLGASAPCVAASSDSSSNDLTQMKDWFSRNVASAPNTPLPVLPRDAPTPKLMNNHGFFAAASGSTLAGPSMRMQGVNTPDHVVQPFPVMPVHAFS
ncbi:unnamed protein product [Closterium sp. NIES-53]